MAALREILVEFGVKFDTKPLEDGNKKTTDVIGSLKALGAALAGAFAVKEIKDFVFGMVEAGDAIGDQAARLGLSSRALEEWSYAAKFADLEAGELDGIFNKLARSVVEAGDATSEQGKVLKKLGVDVKDSAGGYKDTSALFEEVGLALAGMTDQTEKTALSFQFFGKTAGPKVLQLFKDGPAGIAKFREEFAELGGGFGDFVEQAGDVDDQMHRLSLSWTSAKVKIAALFVPALNLAIGGLTKLATWFNKIVTNTSIVQTAIGVLAGFLIVKGAAVSAAWAPIIGTFLLWDAAVAVVVLALEDITTFFKGGDSLIGRAIESWFGPGSAEKVREWGKAIAEGCAKFLDGTIKDALDAIVGVLNLIAAGLSNDSKAIEEFGNAFLKKTAAMSDAIDGLLGKIREVAGWEGPTVEESAKADHAGRADTPFEAGVRSFANFVGFNPLQEAAVQGDLAGIRAGHRISAPAASSSSSSVNNIKIENTTNVNVPPGTPQAQARAAGAAAEAGSMKGANRAARAATERKAP